jgi:hypothetical protein
MVTIVVLEKGNWREVGYYENRRQVTEAVRWYTDKGMQTYCSDGKTILPNECFDMVEMNGGKIWLADSQVAGQATFPDEL